MPTCSYNLQYAQFEHDQVDNRGIAPAADILAAFDTFDWPGQVRTANLLQKCSPTFSVLDHDADRLFWVSACGEPDEFAFVNNYTYQGEVRRFLGLSRRVGPVSPRTNRELSLDEARRGIELFVQGDHSALLQLLAAELCGGLPPN